MKLRSRTTTVLASLALALAACGGADPATVDDPPAEAGESTQQGGGEGADEGPDDGADGSAQADADAGGEDAPSGADGATVLAAAGEEARARSARIAFSITTVTPEGELLAEGEGVSSADGDVQMLMTVSGDTPENDLGELEVRIVDGVIYQRNEQMTAAFGGGATWLAIDPEAIDPEFAGMVSETSTGDPAEVLDMLRDVADVSEVGEEEVNGVATTRYEAVVTRRALLEGADLAELEGYGVDLDATSTMTVWVDGEGLPRRIAYDATFADGVSVSSTHDVLEYDVDVAVEAPPEGETISFADMMGGLGQGG